MLGIKCAYCHRPLHEMDFYLEKPEGKICSRCIVKHKILVGSSPNMLGTYSEIPASSQEEKQDYPPRTLSDPSMERVLVRELEDLLG